MIETPVSGARRNRLLWIYGAALLYFLLKQCYYAFAIGGFPDEMEHLSYIIEMVKSPSLFPKFGSMPLYYCVSEENGVMIQGIFSGTINNVMHPPLYYLFMALTGGIRILPDGTAAMSLARLRAINMLLSGGAVVLSFRLAYTRLKDRPCLVHALYAAAVVTLPMLAYGGTGINNDNLAFLALVVFFAGILRYQEDRLDLKTYLLIGVGFLVGSLSKVTAALIMLLMLFTVLVMSIIRTRSLKLIANRNFLITLPCYLLFLVYELLVKKTYGVFQPNLYYLVPDYYYTTQFYVAPENRVPMSLWQYFRFFAGGVGYTWSSLYGRYEGVTAVMNNGQFGFVYWIPVFAALFAAVRQCVRRQFDRYTLPVVISFLGTLVYHFYSNWTGYPVSGYLGAVQARYYLGLIVCFVLIMCEQLTPFFERTPGRRRLGAVLAVLLIGCWIAGDGLRLVFVYGFPERAVMIL